MRRSSQWLSALVCLAASVAVVWAATSGPLLMQGPRGSQVVGPTDTGQVGTLQASSKIVTPTIGNGVGTQHALPTGTSPLLASNQVFFRDDFGDGSDGSFSNASPTYTTAKHFVNFTLTASFIVSACNTILYVNDTFTMSTGLIVGNGSNASGSNGGIARPAGQFPATSTGANGGLLGGVSATNVTSAFGGAGGAGGAGSGSAGGTAGSVTAPTFPRDLDMWEHLFGYPAASTTPTFISSGSGGGGGGGDAMNPGGGGGGPGCMIVIKARRWNFTAGIIRAKGGQGANGPTTNTGGGGGGGGGLLVIIAAEVIANTGTYDVSGGNGGASGGGTGVAGAAGSLGTAKFISPS